LKASRKFLTTACTRRTMPPGLHTRQARRGNKRPGQREQHTAHLLAGGGG
jgi:hypothetical protein